MKQIDHNLTAWMSNGSCQEYPKDNLIQLFEKMVDKYPDKLACISQDDRITYKELNSHANSLAHFILSQNASHHSPIAIYYERSIGLITAFLAVMKLGRPYIPIDKHATSIQIMTILKDAEASLLLTMDEWVSQVEAIAAESNTKLLILNQKKNVLPKNHHPLASFPASKLAYILYTSGTTGAPKGVQISHKSLVNLLFAMTQEIHCKDNDVLLGITPFTFDLSVPDIYLPLITGGSLVLCGPEARFNPKEIMRCIEQYQVTWMQATPTTWQMLIACGWQNQSNIKIITGGEALTNQLASQLMSISKEVWNFYGPTETTVWSTCHKITSIDKTKPYIPIGRPLANTQVHVFDPNLNPLPVNTPGELYVGGAGVSEGYINNELNSNCFIEPIFGQKLYKTGDLVQWTPEGELYYIGRVDTQIKLRGYRIEVEAIENALLEYPGIQECIVHNQTPDKKTELVVYLIFKTEATSAFKIRDYLKKYFPDYMIPSQYVVVPAFPLTFNGKINRKAIPSMTDYSYLEDGLVSVASELQNSSEHLIIESIQTLLDKKDIHPDCNFTDLGLHSLLLVELTQMLNQSLNQTMSVVDLFTYPTVRSLSQFLSPLDPALDDKQSHLSSKNHSDDCIAIIGMACKFPDADSPKEFWENIVTKKESIRFFDANELALAGVHSDLINHPDYVSARGILRDIEKFDAAFFGYSPSEARLMDPQHRVFLELSWEALEESGYVAEKFQGNIGVFAGMNDSTYLKWNDETTCEYDQQQAMLATSSHYLCTKVAYALGLTGPAITINTACSTSLVAVASACDSLKNNHCDMALAGGISISLPQQSGYVYKDLGILSPTGHCRVFDKDSQGTVMSNGCGIVVLKRLSDALKDKDSIRAVIKGWAVNNDGRQKTGFTAPSVLGQIACIQEAITQAKINPKDIQYIETHGTGTLLGDPIEITALSKAFQALNAPTHQITSDTSNSSSALKGSLSSGLGRAEREEGHGHEAHNNYCALGSVKANLGHTDVASGVAGLIKLTLALQQKTLPPQMNFSTLNEKLNLEHSPFYINLVSKSWSTKSKRLGAVHSLGFGGTNAHVILEEAPVTPRGKSQPRNVFILSAKTEYSLNAMKTKLQDHLAGFSEDPDRENRLADMVFTLQVGRKHFQHRMAVDYFGYEDLVKKLSKATLKNDHKELEAAHCATVPTRTTFPGLSTKSMDLKDKQPEVKGGINCQQTQAGRIIFGFTGQGAQYVNMAFDLYQNQPIFKGIVDACCDLIKKDLPCDLREVLFPKPHAIEEAKKQLSNTLYAQPALFIIEYALAQVFIALGIKPDAMIGHSLGEYVAATLAGVLSVETCLKLITTRARLMSKTKPGGLLVVPLSLETLSSLLPKNLDLAAHNSPNLCVVSGPKEDLRDFEKSLHPLLEKEELGCKSLPVLQAFHSAAMDEILDEFSRAHSEFALNPPSIAYISNVTGRWIQEGDLTPQYWTQHLRNPVLFSEGVHQLGIKPEDIFVEIGPGSTLIQLLSQHHLDDANQRLSTLPHPNGMSDSYQFFLKTLGKLWALRREIHWELFYTHDLRQRISLPTYAFDRQTYWIDSKKSDPIPENNTLGLYTPSWKKDINPGLNKPVDAGNRKTWLLFSNDSTDWIEKSLLEAGHAVYQIGSGDCFEQLSGARYLIDPTQKKHYEWLLESIQFEGDSCIILNSWLCGDDSETSEDILYRGAFSILFLTQLLSERHPELPIHFLALTTHLYSVLGNESILPVKASVLGPCKVIPLEQDNVFCKVIDLPLDGISSPYLAQCIVREALVMDRACAKIEMAYRGNHRWIRTLEPCSKYIPTNTTNRIQSQGVYLITGGLGGIGLALADYLAENYQANIILLSRTGMPPMQEWENYILDHEKKNEKIVGSVDNCFPSPARTSSRGLSAESMDPRDKPREEEGGMTSQQTLQKIKALFNINKKATSLTIEQACVENDLQMQRVVQSILNRFGKLNGVIHAAGLAGGGVAHYKTIDEYTRVLQPKLQGTQTLLKWLSDEPMDFMVFISSITSILGFPGQMDYCSANRILDAYAHALPFKHPVFCMTMNWQAWRDVGMAAESKTKLFQMDATNSHTPAEGVLLFDKLLKSDFNQIIVSSSDPNEVHVSSPPKHSQDKEVSARKEKHLDSVTAAVLTIWCKVLGIDNIQLDDDFYELGGHSLLAISLVGKLKSYFHIKIPASILITAKTVRSLSKLIQSHTKQEPSPLVVLKEGRSSAKPPLFIVHPIGGTVYCYLNLVHSLKNDRAYYGLQDPSLEYEKPLFQTIEEMACFYIKNIQKVQPKGPYYVCGASFGATVVTEMAHQLLAQNEEVLFVGLIDGWASFSRAQLDVHYLETLKLHHQDTAGAAVTPPGMDDPKLWERMLQHRYNMMRAYVLKKTPIQLSLFKARDILSEYQEIDAMDNHWSPYSSLAIQCHTLPGDHNSMLQEPNACILANIMQKQLDLSSLQPSMPAKFEGQY